MPQARDQQMACYCPCITDTLGAVAARASGQSLLSNQEGWLASIRPLAIWGSHGPGLAIVSLADN